MIQDPQTKQQTQMINPTLGSSSSSSLSLSSSQCIIPKLLSLILQSNPIYQPYSQQISQFLFYLHIGSVTIIPRTITSQCIQIYNIRDGRINSNNNNGKEMIRHRVNKKRNNNNNNNSSSNNSSNNGMSNSINMGQRRLLQKLLFRVQEQLCYNCILLILATGIKISVGFGINPQDNMHKIVPKQQNVQQTQNQNNIQDNDDDNNIFINDIRIYPKIQQYLTQNPSTLAQQPINNTPNILFKSIKQLSIIISSHSLNPQQWLNSMNISHELLRIICKQNMLRLEKFQYHIRDAEIYQQMLVRSNGNNNSNDNGNDKGGSGNGKLGDLIYGCYKSIKGILDRKSNKGEEFGSFPRLEKISFNPVFYMMGAMKQQSNTINNIHQVVYQHQYQQQQQHSITQTPLQHLTLLSTTSSLNTLQSLTLTLSTLLPYFPSLTHFSLYMHPQFTFDYFNELTTYLPVYTPYIQSLQIKGNNAKIGKVEGLRVLLRDCGYLGTVDIQLYPRFDEQKDNTKDNNNNNNGVQNFVMRNINMSRRTVNQQFIQQWNIVKQILFKSHHIQRLLNQIRVLQSKGYQTSQCIQAIQLLKPLRIKSMFC